jgi:hypothetical protein
MSAQSIISMGVRPSDLHLPVVPPRIASSAALTLPALQSRSRAADPSPTTAPTNSSSEATIPIASILTTLYEPPANQDILIHPASKVFKNVSIRNLILDFLVSGRDILSCVLVEKQALLWGLKRLYRTAPDTASSKWLTAGVPLVSISTLHYTRLS